MVGGLAQVPIAAGATGQQIRLIDNLDSGRVDNVSDIPRVSTNEKAGVGGVAGKSGKMYCHDLEVMTSNPDQVKLGVRNTSV